MHTKLISYININFSCKNFLIRTKTFTFASSDMFKRVDYNNLIKLYCSLRLTTCTQL